MRRLLFFLIVLAAIPAYGSSLRSMTTLHGPTVYLKDLFDDAGSNAERVLGPGPEPGNRIILEAAQLNAIARQFNVQWRSVSRADRAVLEWPGRPLRKEEILEAIRTAVTAAGAADDCDIDMPGFSALTVPVENILTPTVSQLDYDSATGRFAAALTLTGDGINPINARISGRVDEMTEAPVAVSRLLPETILRPNDVRVARVRMALLQTEVARSIDQVTGMQLRRPVAAGQPLRLSDLTRPPLVQRGATVQIELSTTGLTVSGQVVAIDAGAEGERIRVQNVNSRAFLIAEVVGPGQVRITPDAPAALRTAPPPLDRGVSLR
jgi:flagella basal body P-ring formation protein FlgA